MSVKLLAVITPPTRSLTLNVYVPSPVGLPVIIPELRPRVRPAGRSPLSANHMQSPRDAGASVESAAVYDSPCIADGSAESVVIVISTSGTIVSVNVLDSTTPPARRFTVKVYVPSDVGVPVIAPVVRERLRPGGSAPLSIYQTIESRETVASAERT